MIEAKGLNGRVTFDGGMVTIYREGFMARASVEKGEKRIPVSSITAVQWKPPTSMIRGFIQFTVAGGIERRSRPGKSTQDAAGDENSVVVTKKQADEFLALRAAVEQAMVAPPNTAPSSGGLADELAKLAELRTAGVLTDAEFDAQKAKLLGS